MKKYCTLNFRHGFTLLELMIGIAIIGVTIGLALPDFMGFIGSYRLKKTARGLYNDMQSTRLSAIKQGKTWAIVFDSAGGKYSVCSDKGGDGAWSGNDNTVEKAVALPGESGVQYGHGAATKPAGTSWGGDNISFNNNSATFNSVGTGLAGYVYLQNKHGDAYAVGKESTGFISIKRWTGADWE